MTNQFPKFVSYCRDLNVDLNNASDSLLEVLQRDFEKSIPPPTAAPAATTAAPVTTAVADSSKLNGPVTIQKFVDGPYNIFPRVTIHDGKKRPSYKGAIKDVDLKKGGREKFPCFETYDTTDGHSGLHQDFYRMTSKLWRHKRELFDCGPNADKNARGTYDSKKPAARAHIEWNDDNSIKKISRFQMFPDPVGNTRLPRAVKPTKINGVVEFTLVPDSDPTPVPAVVPPVLLPKSILTTAIIVLDKNDPVLVNDALLKFYGYDPSISIRSLPEKQYQKVLGRVGEIGFDQANKDFIWINIQTDNGDYFDFKHNQKPVTVDLKSIFEADRNLMIEKNKVDFNRLADIFGLMLVVESASQLEIKAVGFCTREKALEYIEKVPKCLMPNGTTYKIERWYLVTELEVI